jgi:hypothetical protein
MKVALNLGIVAIDVSRQDVSLFKNLCFWDFVHCYEFFFKSLVNSVSKNVKLC